MPTEVPFYVYLIFFVTIFLAGWLFYRIIRNAKLLILIAAWLLITGLVAYSGYFRDTNTSPPKFMFAVLPPLAVILLILFTKAGNQFIKTLQPKDLVLLSIVRIPVEVVLYLLYVSKVVPELMTFSGRNFDIIAGLTAPLVYIYCFEGKTIGRKWLLLGWNLISLALLVNIIYYGLFSAPFRFQRFAFDQPNVAVLYFPFIWLPCFIVMIILLSHLILIKKLMPTKPSASTR
jgi:hypothetical protein